MPRLSTLNIKEIERRGQWRNQDPEITGVETNSLRIERGYIFLAKAGNTTNSHGVHFSNQAFQKGASLIITDLEGYQFALDKDLNLAFPFLIVQDLVQTLDFICEIFYSGKPKFVMGITGTNGKTSVANFYQQILNLNKIKVASIGTLGVKPNRVNLKLNNTTVDAITINKILANLKKKKIENVILSASSHGLHQKRLHGIKFSTSIFTNLSRDHLDYHKNSSNYKNAKSLLFSKHTKKNSIAILNIDNRYSHFFFQICEKKKLKILDYGKRGKFLKLSNLKKKDDGYEYRIFLKNKIDLNE